MTERDRLLHRLAAQARRIAFLELEAARKARDLRRADQALALFLAADIPLEGIDEGAKAQGEPRTLPAPPASPDRLANPPTEGVAA